MWWEPILQFTEWLMLGTWNKPFLALSTLKQQQQKMDWCWQGAALNDVLKFSIYWIHSVNLVLGLTVCRRKGIFSVISKCDIFPFHHLIPRRAMNTLAVLLLFMCMWYKILTVWSVLIPLALLHRILFTQIWENGSFKERSAFTQHLSQPKGTPKVTLKMELWS